MNIETFIKKPGFVGVPDFANVDEDAAPQVRNISAVHYEGTTLYFLTSRGKSLHGSSNGTAECRSWAMRELLRKLSRGSNQEVLK